MARIGASVFMLAVLCGAAAASDTVSDGFSGGISSQRWDVVTTGAGVPWTVVAMQTDSCLKLAKPADPGGTNEGITGAVQSKFLLEGDFRISVDFDLVTWPSPGQGYNLARIFIGLEGEEWSYLLGRHNYTTTPIETAHFRHTTDGLIGGPATAGTAMSGTYIIERQGSTLAAWIDSGSGPESCGVRNDPSFTGSVWVELSAQQGVRPTGYRSFSALEVCYDNFQAQADQIVFTPEPATLSLLFIGGLALARRRRR